MNATVRPAAVTDEHLDYLDILREERITNMFGAGEFVARRFDVDRKTAREILAYWMASFAERHPL